MFQVHGIVLKGDYIIVFEFSLVSFNFIFDIMSEKANDKIGEGEIISPSPILSSALSLIISEYKIE